MKQSKRSKLERLLAFEKFIVDELWQHILINAVIALCAIIFNKPVEAVMFCIAHGVIREHCDKQFHCEHTSNCLSMTFTVICLAALTVLPVQVSLLSSIPLALFVVYLGYLIQSKIDNQREIKKLHKYINELLYKLHSPKDIYAMTEEELYEHCRSRGLDDADCKIAEIIVIHRLRGQALYDAINYSERQTKRIRKRILDTIQ
jgi:hypothetical protein